MYTYGPELSGPYHYMNILLNLFGTNIAYAQTAATSSPIKVFVGRVDKFLLNPLIYLLFAAALVYFMYGVLEFFIASATGGEQGDGKNHMLWGVIGFFIMMSVMGIIKLIEHTLGISANPLIG